MISYPGKNVLATIHILRQLAQVVVHVWTPCMNPAVTSQPFRRYGMCKQSVFQYNRHLGPAMESPSATTPAPWMDSVPKRSLKMLEIPRVPFGIPCSQKCLSVAARTTLPWSWESLDTEFKRPVFHTTQNTAGNNKPMEDSNHKNGRKIKEKEKGQK